MFSLYLEFLPQMFRALMLVMEYLELLSIVLSVVPVGTFEFDWNTEE